MTLFSSFRPQEENEDYDPLETMQIEPGRSDGPLGRLEQSQIALFVEQALQALPPRQRQAFVLRYWEELDVAETARAMGCSEGSVKTHCSRATHAIAAFLTSRGIDL